MSFSLLLALIHALYWPTCLLLLLVDIQEGSVAILNLLLLDDFFLGRRQLLVMWRRNWQSIASYILTLAFGWI